MPFSETALPPARRDRRAIRKRSRCRERQRPPCTSSQTLPKGTPTHRLSRHATCPDGSVVSAFSLAALRLAVSVSRAMRSSVSSSRAWIRAVSVDQFASRRLHTPNESGPRWPFQACVIPGTRGRGGVRCRMHLSSRHDAPETRAEGWHGCGAGWRQFWGLLRQGLWERVDGWSFAHGFVRHT